MTARGPKVTVLAVAIALAGPLAAGAVPILDPPDAEELAQQLAEATAVQGICLGWRVQIHADGGTCTGTDVGSSLRRPAGGNGLFQRGHTFVRRLGLRAGRAGRRVAQAALHPPRPTALAGRAHAAGRSHVPTGPSVARRRRVHARPPRDPRLPAPGLARRMSAQKARGVSTAPSESLPAAPSPPQIRSCRPVQTMAACWRAGRGPGANRAQESAKGS